MKKSITSIILFVISLALAIVSYIILPERVITQFSIDGNVTRLPKIIAVLLVFAISGGFSAVSYVAQDLKKKKSYQLISLIGIFVFVILFIVNK